MHQHLQVNERTTAVPLKLGYFRANTLLKRKHSPNRLLLTHRKLEACLHRIHLGFWNRQRKSFHNKLWLTDYVHLWTKKQLTL